MVTIVPETCWCCGHPCDWTPVGRTLPRCDVCRMYCHPPHSRVTVTSCGLKKFRLGAVMESQDSGELAQ